MKFKKKLKWLLPFVVGICYRLGGAAGFSKSWRRWIAPIIAFGFCAIYFKSLIPLACILLYGGATSLGYGKYSFFTQLLIVEWRVRFTVGALIGLSTLPLAILTGLWVVFGFQFLIVTLAMGILGTINPFRPIWMFNGATIEEFIIGSSSVILVPLYLA